MLQRIQTVFLFMIVIFMILYLAFPSWITSPGSEGTVYRMYAFFLFIGTADNPDAGTWAFWPYAASGALAAVVVVVAIIEIFSYKKRMTQVKLGALNSLLLGAVLISSVLFATDGKELWTSQNPGNFSIGIFFPALAMFCNIFANFFIRKDEKLVRSMDRIR